MKSLLVGLGTLAVWAAAVVDVSAAWNNVYQPTLFGRNRRAVTNYYYTPPVVVQSSPVVAAPVVAHSAPACNPCAQPQCSTSYIQRCYYQPVTTYTTQSYYEAVTTMQTSYYYEPVTSYRTSYYYDACSCSYYQVATPTTSYQLRAKSCPVQSWVQRCAQVPVTTYQKSCYLEPRTTCCQTTVGAPIPMGAAAPVIGNPPSVIATPPQNSTPPPQIKETPGPSGPNVGNTSYSVPQSNWQAPATIVPQSNPKPHPHVQLDRIVYGPESFVEGQVVRTDNAPRASANLLFVSADNGKRQNVTANGAGRFQVNLASGNWLVYVQNNDGSAQFHSRLSVQENQTARLTVVN
jgi:hypothetical protein